MANDISLEEGARLLRSARRISIIGCSGGGKTTLANRLSRILNIPAVSMDREFFWLPGWRKRDRGEELDLIAHAVSQECWIMDGTAPSSFHLRLPRTDLVVWIRTPRLLCMRGVIFRALRYIGRSRPEMAPGCREKLDLDFLRYVWTFDKKMSPIIERQLAAYGPHLPVFHLKSRRDMRRLLDLVAARP